MNGRDENVTRSTGYGLRKPGSSTNGEWYGAWVVTWKTDSWTDWMMNTRVALFDDGMDWVATLGLWRYPRIWAAYREYIRMGWTPMTLVDLRATAGVTSMYDYKI